MIHATQNQILPFDPSDNPKEHCVAKQNWKNTPDSNESSFKMQTPNLEFRGGEHFLYWALEMISKNDLFLKKHNHSHVNAMTNNTCRYNLSEVKLKF